MAVRKPEPTDSTVDARMFADAPISTAPTPAAGQPAHERGRLTGVYDLETMTRGWRLRLLRAGAALLASFEITYFLLDRYIAPPLTPATMALHAGAASFAVLLLALTTSKWFERNWRAICFATVFAIYGLTLALRLLRGDSAPLFITVTLSLVATAALVPWSMGWQMALSAAGLGMTGVSILMLGSVDSEGAYRSLSVVVAIILGHFILTMRERYRAEVAGWMDSLRASHQDLADALARSATVMAERELAERRLREGEEMLHKIFDAAPDVIAITRMSDGATLEVNREFLKTGFTREEVLGVATVSLGRWDPQSQRQLVRELRAHGLVRNFETELRTKDGTVVPSLVSATMVELGGEQCVVSITRDISELKRTECELRAAREALSAEVQELEASQARLRDEVAERTFAQTRLAESEATLRKIFEASLDSIAINSLSDGRFIAVNDEFLRVTGHSREEVMAATGAQLKGLADRLRMREMIERLRVDGFVRNFEIELRTKDGRLIPHLFSATVANVAGEPCVIAIVHDISPLKLTERKLIATREALSAEVRELEASQARLRDEIAERTFAQTRLAESEATLRKVFEASLDSIAINRLSDGRFIAVNGELLRITGYSREEVLGVTGAQLKVFADRLRMREMIERLRVDGFVRNFEIDLRTKDGRLIPHLFSATVANVAGEPCVIAIVHDISPLKLTERELIAAREALTAQVNALGKTQERLRAEIAEREVAQRRLQEGEQTLRRIFETSLDTITIKRVSDGRYIEVNNAFATFGYTREETLGKTAEELGTWADLKQLAAFSQRLKLEGQVRNSEVLCRTRDGRIIPSLISAVTVELGGEQCVVSFVRDIRRLKQTESELIAVRESALAASEAKSHFLSVMSHEIRTPMNAILGMADLLWETSLNTEQRRYLDTMRNNSTSLLNLVNGILDLSKVESGRLSLERVHFDLVELAEGVMETLGVRAHEKGLELALRIPSTFPTALTGDPLRLRQILINLLGNAIKFTERGEVTLTIDAVGAAQAGEALAEKPKAEDAAASADTGSPVRRQLLRFVVRDTGIGIPANQLQAIFSNFTQADSTISRRYGGSGLGLAIVKRLVELMNGRVAVESRPREGSSFNFTIALELQPGAGAGESPAPAGMTRLSGTQVLVVDDSPASRAILAELLALAGAEVVVAADGAGALAELARARAAGRPYDAVVADNRMPAPDGLDIGRQILHAAHTPREALVLMLTANDLHSQLGRLREWGLEESQRCRYLLKPVRRMDLWATVAAAGAADERANLNGADTAAAGHAARHEAFIQRATPRRAAMLVNKPLRILLAEDSPDNRLLVEAYLKDTPYQLDHAENGEVAVHKFMTGHYDAILMDIQMPVMDGYEATAEIRRLEQSDHRRPTPIIALTASAHEEAVRRSFKMGCDAHVTKPVKRSTLLESIRDAVEPAPQSAPSPAEVADSGAGSVAAVGSQQPIVVQIDQDLSDLVPGFLARKAEDARAVLAAAERHDVEAIVRLGHKMKGEGGSYGLDAITDIGRELEQAGKDSDFDAARRLGRDLINFLDRLEIVYRPMED